jgi:hypothetical protein
MLVRSAVVLFLSKLEEQLATLPDAARAELVTNIRDLFKGLEAFGGGGVKLGMKATLSLASWFVMRLNGKYTNDENMAALRAQAAKTGPHVQALFSP